MTNRKRRPTIGENPLDFAVPSGTKRQAPHGKAAKATPAPRESARTTRPAKVRATFHLPEDLFEEARDAVVHLSGPPLRLTLAELAETALRREIERLRKAHTGGRAFPKRSTELKGGRPIKV